MEPAPNYTTTTDPLDTQQLTDGRTSEATLWHDTAAVGWRSARPVTITIDLGEVRSIGELRWHAAAGSGEVKWPAGIDVFLSSDAETFNLLGDLVAGDPEVSELPADGYRAHTLRLAIQPQEARYVRFMADRDGSYVFADEIEVLGGASVRRPEGCPPVNTKPPAPVADTQAVFWVVRAQRRAALAVERDAAEISERIASLDLESVERAQLDTRLANATAAAKDALKAGPLTSSRLPLNSPHQDMYATAAAAEIAAGGAPLSIWSANPWDPLRPLARSDSDEQSALSTALMRGERRAMAFNVRISGAAPLPITLRASVPGLSASEIRLYRVNWTGNDESRWAAAELELLGDGAAQGQTMLLPGITQQIWVQVEATDVTPGQLQGTISVSTASATDQVPIDVLVFRKRMPQALSMHFGGWDYSEAPAGYAVTAANRTALIEYLRSSHVDSPWATRRVLHWDHVANDGSVSALPNTAQLERWLRNWPSARRFRVYVSARDAIGGVAMSDPRFGAAVSAWALSWASEIRKLHRSPEEFELLLVDEPQSATQSTITTVWANAIRRSGAGFKIWSNPIWPDPNAIPTTYVAALDTVSINLPFLRQHDDKYWGLARSVRESGKTLEVYAASGPARLLDPYAYYRLAFWRAHAIGATGVTLWSFSDTRGSTADNEFAGRDYNYSPLFIWDDGVRAGKQMEAAVEGLQDAEYLHTLAIAKEEQLDEQIRAGLQKLLDEAQQLVLSAGTDDLAWNRTRDRTAAERLRARIGAALDELER